MRLPMMILAAAAALHDAPVSSLMREAIDRGRAAGPVNGPVADEARRKLNATGALSLTVTRIHRFERADCARLQLDFTQDAALLPGSAAPAPYSWSTRMNICADGSPPSTLKRSPK